MVSSQVSGAHIEPVGGACSICGRGGPISEADARRAAAEDALKQKEQADENKLAGINLPDIVRKVPNDGGNSTSYRLRRLAREEPEILEAYGRGRDSP